MATLGNVNGGSLTPDLSNPLNMLLQTFGTKQQRDEKAAQQAQQSEIQDLTGSIPSLDGVEQEKALARLASINPDLAKFMNGVLERGDKQEQAQILQETESKLREAVFISKQDTYQGKINAITNLAQQQAAEGKDISDLVKLGQLPEEQLDLEIQKAQILGQDVKSLTAAPAMPKTREIKQGDSIVTQQFNPSTGQFENIATADRFQSKLLTPEELAQKQQIANAGRSTTTVSVGDKGAVKESEEMAKLRVKQYGEVSSKAENARDMIESLDNLDAIDVDTGTLEPAKLALASTLEGFGIDSSSITNVANAQAYNAASNRLVNNVLNMAKGPQTEGDAKRAITTIANLKDVKLANQFKNNSLRAVALRQIEQSEFYDSVIESGGNVSEAKKKWNEYKRKTPSLSGVVKNPETGLPMYFYQFKQIARSKRPDITDEGIISAWRSVNAK